MKQKFLHWLVTMYVALAVGASGQTNVWNTFTGDNPWATAGNWTNSYAPPNGGGTTVNLQFDNTGGTPYTANNDFTTTPFSLNQLILGSTGGGTITLRGNQLKFDGTNPFLAQNGTGTILISNAVQLATTTRFTGIGAGAVIIHGAVSGGGGLFVTGSGSLTVANSSANYSGATTVSNGTLRLVDTTSLATAITVTNGTLILSRNVTGFANRSHISGSISGSGTININNAGSGVSGGWVTLNGSNPVNFSGTININSGVLSMDNIAGTLNGNPTLNVASGGVFGLRFQNVQIGGLNGNGDVCNNYASAQTLTIGGGNASGNFSGIIHGNNTNPGDGELEQGQLAVTKIGTGTQVLSGANTYVGGTTINDGTLSVSADNNLGGSGGALTFNGGVLAVTGSYTNSRVISFNSGSATFSVASGVTLTLTNSYAGGAPVRVTGGGTLVMIGSPVGYSGGTTVSNATLVLQNTFNYASTITMTNNSTVILNKTVDTGFANRASTPMRTITGSGTVIYNGAGSGISGAWVTLTSVNPLTLAGTIFVNSGVLSMDNLTGSINGSPSLTVSNGGVFGLRGQNITFDALNGNGDIANTYNLGNNTLTFGNLNGSGNFSGIIHGNNTGADGTLEAGTLSILKAGTGTQVLAGSNTFIGTVTINAGTLTIGGAGVLGNGSYANTIANSGVLEYNSSANQVLSGVISGSGALIKAGTGTLTLSANNTYSGGTVINAGRISLTGTLASSVTVNSGGTLQGTGRVNGTVSGAGFVSPGNSPGILTATQLDPTGVTDFGFEFTATGDPTWSNAGASVNDVFRLTHATTPFTADLDSSNTLGIYFNVPTLALGNTFRGGFFTDRNSNFTLAVDNATYNFYVYGDGGGSINFNGVNYYTLAQYNANNATSWGITRSVVQVPAANFSGGTVNNGWVQQFEIMDMPGVVPEPSTVLLLGVGGWLLYRRVRRR